MGLGQKCSPEARGASCRLVLLASDRRRFAATELEVEARPQQHDAGACGDLAVSPNGTHVAFWRRAGAEEELMMASLAWPGARVVLGTSGRGGALDWTDGVRLAELGLSGAAVAPAP